MKKALILILLFLPSLGFSQAGFYFNNGISLYNKKDYNGAIVDFTKSITFHNDDFNSYTFRGKCKTELKDYLGAINDYNKAIELNPKFDVAYTERGTTKMLLNNYDGAIADLSQAIT
jgi:tetratricopeptide (TPR) repeat protein